MFTYSGFETKETINFKGPLNYITDLPTFLSSCVDWGHYLISKGFVLLKGDKTLDLRQGSH